MLAKGLNPILNVRSVPETIAWFAKLGWARRWEWQEHHETEPGFAAVYSGSCEIFLCRDGQGGRGKSDLKSTSGPDGNDRSERGVWMSIWVDDVDAIHRHCLAEGLEVTHPPTNERWGVREMHLRHPDGHVFRISRGLKPEEKSDDA